MDLDIHIDGGSRGNPGPAAAGVLIEAAEDPPFVVHEAGYFLGRTTNNVAEYQGLIRALELAVTLKPGHTRIFSDSELMVKQLTGQYRVKSADLKPLFDKAAKLLLKLELWRVQHVYREENKRADELANMAMDAGRDVIVTSGADFKGLVGVKPAKPAKPAAPAAPVQPAAEQLTLRWTVTLQRDPGSKCPARCPAGKKYTFGPDTPAGLCIHAAQAALEDGPLEWAESHEAEGETTCAKCGVGIRIRVVK